MKYVLTVSTTIEEVMDNDSERFRGMSYSAICDILAQEVESALRYQTEKLVKLEESGKPKQFSIRFSFDWRPDSMIQVSAPFMVSECEPYLV